MPLKLVRGFGTDHEIYECLACGAEVDGGESIVALHHCVPAPDVETRPADERWSFARRCVQAGYDIYANHATAGEAQEYERVSAEIDAKTSEMVEPHHSPRGLCNDCGNEIEREAGSFTHCRRCVRLRDLEHELSELRASSAPAEPTRREISRQLERWQVRWNMRGAKQDELHAILHWIDSSYPPQMCKATGEVVGLLCTSCRGRGRADSMGGASECGECGGCGHAHVYAASPSPGSE